MIYEPRPSCTTVISDGLTNTSCPGTVDSEAHKRPTFIVRPLETDPLLSSFTVHTQHGQVIHNANPQASTIGYSIGPLTESINERETSTASHRWNTTIMMHWLHADGPTHQCYRRRRYTFTATSTHCPLGTVNTAPSDMSSDTQALFKPTVVGQLKLAHRVVMAPLTRLRADDNHVPTKLGVKYYEQRASVAGTLLITEGTFISPQAGGIMHAPGIWSAAQIAAWKRITDVVHAKGSSIYLQLWAMGRTARPPMLHRENPDYPHVAPSPIPLSSSPDSIPRELTKDEIKEYVQWYATAAANAVHEAGFDGVEITAANGYLIDQFLQDVSNQRTDEYGGPVENRARFALEVVEAVVEAVGQMKTAIRLSPWSVWQDMREENPVPTFSYLTEELKEKFPNLAYLHVVAPSSPNSKGPEHESDTHFIHKIWAPRAMITTGGYDRESGLQVADETGQLVGYGTAFLANPDLPFRLQHNIELNEPDQQTVYLPMSEKGYTTYPFSEEFLTLASELEAHYLPKSSPRLVYP